MNRIYLTNSQTINQIAQIVSTLEPPFLQIGPGHGNITRVLPKEKLLLVENNLKVQDELKDYTVIYDKIQNIKHLDCSYKTLVSNLPFDQSIAILVHCLKYFDFKDYLVLIDSALFDNIKDSKRLISFKFNHFFSIQKVIKVPKSHFTPITVNAVLLHLRPKKINWTYIDQLNKIRHPRKFLKNNGILWCKQLENKRLCEIDQKTMYHYYLKFYRS